MSHAWMNPHGQLQQATPIIRFINFWLFFLPGYVLYYGCNPERGRPNGVNQAPALVGTVIRAKPMTANSAGVVASLIAVKQP